jgi:protein-S-isoprenylcysteine O-methyltransferase Ste14
LAVIDPERGPLSQPGTVGVPLGPLGIVAGDIILGLLLRWAWPLPLVAESYRHPVRLVGIALGVLWLALAIWSVRTFRKAGTSPNPTAPSKAIATDGPYRFTRNPMYVGMMCLMIGLALTLNSVALLLTAVVAWFLLRYAVIAPEERYLEAKFGQAYTDYKARVRRWI